MSMALTSGFFPSSLGTVTVSTPFSMAAFTWSILAFSGSLNRRTNLPLLLSTRCHLSVFSSCSLLRSPLTWITLPSSTSTFTSSFFNPGRSTLTTCASGVSFQSTRGLATAAVSLPQLGALATAPKPSNGSKMAREKGSKMLLRLPPKKLGIRAMFSSALENKKRFSMRLEDCN
ncbi:hypothetical protein RJ640_025957 [Escallonia rubra]|uniref:Uncharacterized protein n=1 Tax=Escallonia rubra TaxID=112253 RepID=A0AA88UB90_9ASTE|nr:hypothetical protein RJ640_025957 [Escallonia rubra]